jgi:hypothetical protein
MKKLHVDEILKKKEENLPGPGNYEAKPIIANENSIRFSIRPKCGDNDYTLKRQRKMPGPGHY